MYSEFGNGSITRNLRNRDTSPGRMCGGVVGIGCGLLVCLGIILLVDIIAVLGG